MPFSSNTLFQVIRKCPQSFKIVRSYVWPVFQLSSKGFADQKRIPKALIYAIEKLSNVKGLHIYGTKDMSKRGGVISFNFADVHPHDVAQIIDEEGISVRSGHHCAQVLMERLNVAATSRASFYIYNTKQDIDILVNSLNIVAKVFKL